MAAGKVDDLLVGPILIRELLTTPRRPHHYLLRGTYLSLLFVLMWTAWQAIVGFQQLQRPGDFAFFNTILFEVFAYTQLTLVLFGASLYGASSISHEKDRRTFILLLITQLGDGEIVINKFLCGLLQVAAVLLAALPVFLICVLLGGVGFGQISQVYAITLGAAILSGATGVLVAVWRDKTFQAVAMTMLAVVLSLLAVEVVATLWSEVTLAERTVTFWCACLSPFRALAISLRGSSDVANSLPVVGHVSVVFLTLSIVLAATYLIIAIVKLRDWNPRGEPIQQRELDESPDGQAAPARRQERTRNVWVNPVLWREMMTRAYGTRPVLIKLGYFLVFGILLARLLLASPTADDPRVHFLVAQALLPLAVISLLLINAQSVSAVTSERDLRSIDLLLATDITPKEFVYGKLLGVLYNTKEMVLLPILLVGLCAVLGLMGTLGVLYTSVVFLVFVIFGAVLGIHAAFRYPSTRLSLANSLGTMFLLFVGMLLCLFLILISGRFEAQWASFIVFIFLGSIGLWVSLSADAPSNAITLTAAITPFATFYCVIAFLVGDRTAPFLVGAGVYSFAVLALIVPLLHEFDVAAGRTTLDG